MASEKQITIRISARDEFSAVVSKYQQAMGQAASSTEKLNESSDKASTGGLTGLNNQLNNLMTAFAGIKVIQLAGELNEIGDKANKTDATFRNLSGGIGEATANLQLLRDATQGTVADTDLQIGANKLFAMQLASTGDEAARMAGIAVTLGRAMGEEAAPAIENFALMLSNQSLLRLDSIGVSSAAVRERMKELADEFPNMDKQARFTQATMEIAEKTITRLGDSATANATNLDKLGTALKNLRDDAGQGLNTVLNEAAGSLTELLDIAGKIRDFGFENVVNAANGISLGSTQRADLMGRIAAQQDTQSIYDTIVRDFNGGANSQFILDFITTGLQAVRDNPALKNSTDELARYVMNELIASGQTYEDANSEMAATYATGIIQIQASNEALREQKQAAMDAAAGFYALDEAYAPVANAHVNQALQERNALLAQNTIAAREFYATDEAFAPTAVANVDRVAQERVAAMKRNLDAAKATFSAAMSDMTTATGSALGDIFSNQGGMNAGLASPMGDALTMMQRLTDFQVSAAMPDYLSPDVAERLAGAYSDAEAEFSRLKDLNEEGLISDDQLSQAEIMKDNIKSMADEAKRASDAFQSMKLADAFGQTGGGMAGEMTQDMVKRMKDSGNYTDAQIEAFQRSAGLASGTETQASIAYNDQVQPLIQDIFDKYGAEAAAKAMMDVQTYLQQATLRGDSPSTIAKNLPNSTGYSYTMGAGGGQAFTVAPGQTPGEIAAQLGVPVSQVIGAAGAADAQHVLPGTYQLGGNVAPIQGYNPATYGAPQMLTTGQGGEDSAAMTQPFEDIADSSKDTSDNMRDIAGQFSEIGDKAAAITNALDLASAARDVVFTFKTIDQSNGALALLINAQQVGTLNLTSSGSGRGGGGARGNGGRVPGVDQRVGQQPSLG